MTEAELRPARLRWSALCLVLFLVLGVLVETVEAVQRPRHLAGHRAAVVHLRPPGRLPLLGLGGQASSFYPEAVATLIAAAALAWKNYRRAAVWTLGVMATTPIANRLLKEVFGARPPGLGRADPSS